MNQAVAANQKLQTEAGFLASDFDLELTGHEPSDYDALVRAVAEKQPDCQRNHCFVSVSKYLTEHCYRTKDLEVQQIVARTALLAIHQLQFRVGDIEEQCEIGGGNLAKLKSGKCTPQTKLSPWQIVLLATELRLSIDQLVTDFTDRPNDLQQILQPPVAEEPPQVIRTTPETRTQEVSMSDKETATVAEVSPPQDIPVNDVAHSVQELPEPPARPPDPLLAQHIRAAIKRSSLNVTEVMRQTEIGNRAHLNQMERGKATLSDEQVQRITDLLEIPIEQLYSGEGLKVTTGSRNALTIVGSEHLSLPPLSVERRQTFYRDLCLRRGVQIAEGEDVGELLEAARAEDYVDWYSLWLRVTEQGVRFRSVVDQVSKKTRSMGQIARADFLKELYQEMFPEKDTSE